MEKTVNDAIRQYIIDFKAEIIQKRHELSPEDFCAFVADKEPLRISLGKPVPENRCTATRSNGKQCSRKRKDDQLFCGTHLKSSPTTLEVQLENFDGIYYYVDKQGNAFRVEDVNKENAEPFSKYVVEDGKFTLVS